MPPRKRRDVPDSSGLKSRSLQWIDQDFGARPFRLAPLSSQPFFRPFEASVRGLVERPKQLGQHKYAIRWL
jgi:hypothetical protein